MKRFLAFTVLILLTISEHSLGQKEGTKIGFRFGAGTAGISEAGFTDERNTGVLTGGLTINHQISRNFGILADLMYTTKGTSAIGVELWENNGQLSIQQYKDTYTLDYIELPIMAKYSAGAHLLFIKFYGGPSAGINIRAFQTRQYQDHIADAEEGFSRRKLEGRNLLEFGAAFGTGIDFQRPDNRMISLDVKNHMGLTPLGVINGRNAYNNYFAITFGYLY